jgi:hypothetical protein
MKPAARTTKENNFSVMSSSLFSLVGRWRGNKVKAVIREYKN